MIKRLTKELSTASNIKDKNNRLSVKSALTSALEKLKLLIHVDMTNGLALFANSQKCLVLTPPRPIQNYLYKCDRCYHIDTLKKLYESNKAVYLVVFVTGNESYIYGLYKGLSDDDFDKYIYWSKTGVSLQKNQKKGGQSAPRIGRLHDEKHKRYAENIANNMSKCLNENPKIQGIILTGPSIKKKHVFKAFDRLNYCGVPFLGFVTISYVDDDWKNVYEMIIDHQMKKDDDLLKKIMNIEDSKNIFGQKEVYINLKNYMLDMLIIHKDHPDIDKLPMIERRCKSRSCKLVIVSSRNSMGESLLKNFQGVAGRMRF